MDRRLKVVVAALLVGASVAGCGGEGAGSTAGALTPVPISPVSKLSHTAPAALRRAALPAVGTTQQVDTRGAALSVTLRAVLDPLRGSGAALQPGMRAVGLVVQIRNAGPQLYDSSATGDFSVVPSSGIVSPVLARRGVCKTPLEDFDRYITAGEDRVGCVVLEVAAGATLDAVRFSPHAEAAGRLEWAP